MQKKKIKLQQRIFVSFFLIVLSLFFILFLSTWYIFNIGIQQTEKNELSKIINNTQISFNNYKRDIISDLSEINNNPTFIESVKVSSIEMIEETLIKYPEYKTLIVYDKDSNIIYGAKWNLIENYYYMMLQHSLDIVPSTFTVNHGNKIYFISFLPINNTC